MAGHDIFVVFGATTAGLEASLATAKAGVNAFASQMRDLAKQMQATGASAESDLGQKLLAAAGNLSGAKGSVADLKVQLATMSSVGAGAEHAIASIGQAATHGVEGLSFYTREIRALFDELSSGRDRQALGTFSNLAGHFLSAHTALIPLVAGVAAIGAAAAYAAFEFVGFVDAIGKIEASAAIDQIAMTGAQIEALETSIKTAANVSNAEAADIAAAFMKIGDGGQQIAQIAAFYIPQFVRAGDTASEAAKQLADLFLDLGKKGREYVAATQGVSGETLKAYDGFVAAGQSGQAYAIIVDSMRSRLEASREAQIQRSAALRDDTAATADAVAAVESGLVPAEKTAGVAVAEATSKIAGQVAELGRLRDALAEAGSANASFTKGLAAALKFDKIGQDIVTTTGDIATMNQAFRQAASAGDAPGVATLAAGIDRATDSLKKLKQEAADGLLSRDATGQADAAIAHLDATWKGSTVARLTAEREVWQQIASGENSTAEQIAHARAEVESKSKEITAASFSDYKAAEFVRAAVAGKASAAVIAIRQQEVAKAREIFGAGSDQEKAAIEEVARAKEAAATRGASAAKAGAKDETAAAIEAANEQLTLITKATQQKIAGYNDDFKLHAITENAKVQSTLDALQDEYQDEQDVLNKELALDNLRLQQRQKILDQLASLEQTYASQVQKVQLDAADKVEQQWQSVLSTIDGAFNSQVSGLINHTTTFQTAMHNVLTELASRFATFALDIGLNWALNLTGMKSAVTAFNAMIAPLMASGAASTAVASKPGIMAQIAADGGEAYAGFAAFFAPIMGPGAIGAAAGLAAQVTGTATSMAALDVGAWEIPHNMAAIVHQGETVMPTSFASGFRSAMAGAGAGGSGSAAPSSVGLTVNMSAIDSVSGLSFLQGNLPALARMLQAHVSRNPSSFPGGL